MSIVGNPILLSGGSGGKLNIFSGMTEPSEKNGIWIQSEQEITNIVQDNDVWTPDAFYDTGVTITSENHFFANNAATNKVFYYNGYIYKFQNNAKGNGLYRSSKDNINFELVKAFSVPSCGVVQDPVNPQYLYGGVVVDSEFNGVKMHKYDLENLTDTMLGSIYGYYWSYGSGSSVIYNNCFYGFGCNSTTTNGQSPQYIYKYNLEDNKSVSVLNLPTVPYPRMTLIGSNMYIMFVQSNVLSVYKIDLTAEELTMTPLNITGDTDIGMDTSSHILYTTDNANKIYLMACSSSVRAKSLFVVNVEECTVTKYDIPNVTGFTTGDGAMMYYNGTIYIYALPTTSSSTWGIYHFKLSGKPYPSGTLAIVRSDNNSGVFETELISPKDRPIGAYNMFKTGYNMVYQSIDGQLVANHPVYNGDGSSWEQIR